MGVIKLSKSGKAVMFTGDDGTVYMCAKVGMERLLNGTLPSPFIVPSKLPLKVSLDRFKPSPIYDPSNLMEKMKSSSNLTNANDALSVKQRRDLQQEKSYVDKKIEW